MKTVKDYLFELDTTQLVDTYFEEYGEKLYDLYYFNSPTCEDDRHIDYDESVRDLSVYDYAQAERKAIYDFIKYLKTLDITECSFEMLPEGSRPEVLFQTHSHGDHYNPTAAVKSGVKRIYVQETWASAAREDIERTAQKLSLPAPEVVALPFGKPVDECGMRFTGVPANHSTSRVTDGVLERASLYLVEKGPARLLYAVDTGGLMGDAARMIGIDPHIHRDNYGKYSKSGSYVAEPKAITALVMEATDGDSDDDFRQFVHSSVQNVHRIVQMLKKHKRYSPPSGQCAYITHLGLKYRAWPSEQIDAELPEGMRSAGDGLEVVLG